MLPLPSSVGRMPLANPPQAPQPRGSPQPSRFFISIPLSGQFCLCKSLGMHGNASIPTEISQGWYKGTSLWPLCAQGWHPLMVCHPCHGRNRGHPLSAIRELAPGWERTWQPWPLSPVYSSPGDVTRAGGKETAAPTAACRTGHWTWSHWAGGDKDRQIQLRFCQHCCHGETQLQQQHRVPTCPLSSLASKRAMTQLQHLLPTVGSPCHCGLLVPLAVLCEHCPAGYYHRKSCNTTANLPAQPCYKSGSGGSAVRQSLPVRAPAPNVLLPHT